MRRSRVVLCDEHRSFCEALAERLSGEADLEVVEVVHGFEDLLAALRRHRPDLLILDPVIASDGDPGPIAAVRHASPETAVIALTAETSPTAVAAALRAGAAGWLLKTISLAELVEAVRGVLREEYRVAPEVLSPALRAILAEDRASDQVTELIRRLTPREYQVLAYATQGLSSRAIAERLGLADSTVRKYIQRVLTKLQVHSILAAAALGRQAGLEKTDAVTPLRHKRRMP
ncbi:response regulator transcription factor [Carbonactinospora thermoautotrophica]|uniref:response regulator transcription factor n=1 Tax=Carbonactinospora thermoautotrophica TaxID=1469144 RepID=UPI000830A983|nr:response regulator transcription factor [Carbonactinospora thermoautotrophica]